MTTEIATAPTDKPTMSSLELVDFINSERKKAAEQAGAKFPSKGFAKLAHDDFMAKVPKVIGADAPNFSGTQSYGNNNTRAIYIFPKREACLMAMSYSYALQAKVFDPAIFAASLGVQPEVRANRSGRPVVLLRSPAVDKST